MTRPTSGAGALVRAATLRCGRHKSAIVNNVCQTTRGMPVAKPNYSFEKRQRELAKKRKKEEKAARKSTPGGRDDAPEAEAGAEGGEAGAQPPATPTEGGTQG